MKERPKPKRAPAASAALRASATTSGPMPSPARTATRWPRGPLKLGLRAEDAAEGGPALGLLGRRLGCGRRRGHLRLHVDAEDPGHGGARLLRMGLVLGSPGHAGTSFRSVLRASLLTAWRYARAEASTTSVATPRPVTRVPSCSTCTVTSPRASVPPLTADTWNSTSLASTPVAAAMAAQAASTMPSPMADCSTTPASWLRRTVAVGDITVPPATWRPTNR